MTTAEKEYTYEEMYILILDNAVEEAENREARMKRQIGAMIADHRQLQIDVQEMEEKLQVAREHFLNRTV